MEKSSVILFSALIATTTSLLAIVIKDVVIEGRRQKRRRKREIIDKKLTLIYGPLYAILVIKDKNLENMYESTVIYNNVISNMHLLSPRLLAVMKQHEQIPHYHEPAFGSLPEEQRKKAYKANRLRQKINREFKDMLTQEISELRQEYQGGKGGIFIKQQK